MGPIWNPVALPIWVPYILLSGFPSNMRIWVPYGTIKGVQLSSTYVPYGLSHMGLPRWPLIWLAHDNPIKKIEIISINLFKLMFLFIIHD